MQSVDVLFYNNRTILTGRQNELPLIEQLDNFLIIIWGYTLRIDNANSILNHLVGIRLIHFRTSGQPGYKSYEQRWRNFLSQGCVTLLYRNNTLIVGCLIQQYRLYLLALLFSQLLDKLLYQRLDRVICNAFILRNCHSVPGQALDGLEIACRRTIRRGRNSTISATG